MSTSPRCQPVLLADLRNAVADAAEAGRRVPCLGGTADWWTSGVHAEIEAACHACGTCPVLAICAAYRDQHHEPGAVFAGRRPDPLRGRSKARS